MLGSEEEVRSESSDPVWEGDNEVIPILLIHGGKDLR
jgi:hypothetical protein